MFVNVPKPGFDKLIVVAVVLLLLGCGKSKKAIHQQVTKTPTLASQKENKTHNSGVASHPNAAANSEESKDEQDSEPQTHSTQKAGLETDDAKNAEDSESSDQSSESNDTTDANELTPQPSNGEQDSSSHPPKHYERILVFVSSGPLILDMSFAVDGISHLEATNQLIDQILSVADEDGDGETLWSEITNNPSFVYGQYGNARIENEQSRQTVVRSYDINQNKRVDRTEVLGFLRQDSSQSRPFQMSDPNAVTSNLENADGLFRFIDRDDDKLLDATEINQAAQKIWINDRQDDQILVAADFESPAPISTRRAPAQPLRRGAVLTDFTNWSRLLYSIEDVYNDGNPLTSGIWSNELFESLDTDTDGYLHAKEFKRIANFPAHLRLDIDFSGDPSKIRHDPPNHEAIQVLNVTMDRIELNVAGDQIQIVLSDSANQEFVNEQLTQIYQEHDKNKDEYLNNDEYQILEQRFNVPMRGVDADDNKMIYKDEMRRFLELRTSALVNRVVASIDNSSDSVFSFLDENNDDRLSIRETESMSHRMLALDVSEDGYITTDEFPNVLRLQIRRGDRPIAVPSVQIQGSTSNSNDWFGSMDANQDGEISRREFIGPSDVFHRFDKDQNGVIDSHESENSGR